MRPLPHSPVHRRCQRAHGRQIAAAARPVPGSCGWSAPWPPSAAQRSGKDAGVHAGRRPSGVPITRMLPPLLAQADVVVDFSSAPAAAAHVAACVARARAAADWYQRAAAGASCAAGRRGRRDPAAGGAQHQPGRDAAAGAGAPGRPGAAARLRYRDPGGASPPQGRCALGHGAGAGRGCGRGPRRESGEQASCSAPRAPGCPADGQIGFAVVRGGDVVGEHEVLVSGARASGCCWGIAATDRAVFARGALLAAQWLAGASRRALRDAGCFY